jgi:cytochrome c553
MVQLLAGNATKSPPDVADRANSLERTTVRSLALKMLTLSVLACSIGPVLAEVSEADKKAASKMAKEVCASCHGPAGRSTSPTFPRLAGQTREYLEAQLKAFRDQSRGDPDAIAYMWGMASQLSDSSITALAEYFAQQPPYAGNQISTAASTAGRQIFEQGVPSQQIPACETCHGKGAVGMGAFPRLAGQHAPYLFKQMLVIQSVLRSAPVMHGVVKDLTREQMQQLSVYLESL